MDSSAQHENSPISSSPILLPVQVEAFCLNPEVCGKAGDRGARIAPITQPNYTFLRLDNQTLQSDVLPHVDMHNTAPAGVNIRMTDLGAEPPQPRRNRQGVYVHWILPRTYRTGMASMDSAPAVAAGDPPQDGPTEGSASTPTFIEVPNRWLVIRKIDRESIKPDAAKDYFKEKEYDGWVVESDFRWKLDDIPDDYDLQVDVSPYVGTDASTVTKEVINEQAEVFIGRKTNVGEWKEEKKDANFKAERVSLKLLQSSNQLFADFQLHNSNVFSILDNFVYGSRESSQYLEAATASYYVIGWHSEISPENDPLYRAELAANEWRSERLKGLFMKLASESKGASEWCKGREGASLLSHGAIYNVRWDANKAPESIPANEFASRLQSRSPKDPTDKPDPPAIAVGTTPLDSIIAYINARQGTKGGETEPEKTQNPESEKVLDSGGVVSRPDKDPKSGDTVLDLEKNILALETLLHARDDGVESQREAMDTIYNWNFDRSQGGITHSLRDTNIPLRPSQPTTGTGITDHIRASISQANSWQIQLDTAERYLKQLRWDVFSLWWKYSTGFELPKKSNQSRDELYSEQVKRLIRLIEAAETLVVSLQKDIKHVLPAEDLKETQNAPTSKENSWAQKSASPPYYRAKDPTALVGGIPSGWAVDFLDDVKVRLPSETIGFKVAQESEAEKAAEEFLVGQEGKKPGVLGRLPGALGSAIRQLFTEFRALHPDKNDQCPMTDMEEKWKLPLFHDQDSLDGESWRDLWANRQPWFPLFVEWEVEYTHIPFRDTTSAGKAHEFWTLDSHTARASQNKMTRYGLNVKQGQTLSEELRRIQHKDVRIIAGRSLILPQPSFSLAAKVEQLFSDTPDSVLSKILGKDKNERAELVKEVKKLSYLSAPLTGIVDGLVTLQHGTHLKPENRPNIKGGGISGPQPTDAALNLEAGFTLDSIGKIQGESSLTPYGNAVQFGEDDPCPFKPVTHGQFRFRRFNIIDKFGQALVAIDPTPSKQGLPPLYPAISEYFQPQLRKDVAKQAETVRDNDVDHCEYIQIPPQINQDARLNASFVVEEQSIEMKGSSYWRPAADWENPVWGWLVINYANYGIQFFLPDGSFYREVRIGGPNGALKSAVWAPFKPTATSLSQDAHQLEELIAKLEDLKYLQDFWDMIILGLDSLQPAPSSYAQYLNALVGKPLALVNMGWSLELAKPELVNQAKSSDNPRNPPESLLRDGVGKADSVYDFHVKFGDRQRAYDGLVGYFKATPTPDLIKKKEKREREGKKDPQEGQQTMVSAELKQEGQVGLIPKGGEPQDLGDGVGKEPEGDEKEYEELQLGAIYTYFVPATKQGDSLKHINVSTYPTFNAFYVNPLVEDKFKDKVEVRNNSAFISDQNRELQVFGVIMDPFTPVHAYTSILPPKALQLPSWTWQEAMKRMTAFFHMGPLTLTDDVPAYDKLQNIVQSDDYTERLKNEAPPFSISLPALQGSEWNWLQPYVDPDSEKKPGVVESPEAKAKRLAMPPAYNALGIEQTGNLSKPSFSEGPYTAIEGYLQLRRPLMGLHESGEHGDEK
ncbi:hypothetical protein BJ508DRAFT_418898 [Ascobolus immersus RN42]|uniref:Uncharacterized protein n=1 Tax=Ascobolus immersus RN42 TaxID=1160509 RepID=A0A3N4HMS4_ASCIM|nr:hypothetical protein BJ508DRAFT_418898 [Ascobolus immersus RN42]